MSKTISNDIVNNKIVNSIADGATALFGSVSSLWGDNDSDKILVLFDFSQ